MNVTFSSRPGRRVSSINGLRIVLIACALLFSLYAGIRVMSPSQRAKKTAQQLELSSTEGVQRRHRMLGHEGEDKSVQHSGLKEGSMVDGEEQGVSCSTAVTTPPCPACPACEAKAEAQDQRPQYLPVARYLRNPRRYHVVTTVQGFSNHWQARIHYYWFKRQKEVCEEQAGGCDMGGFTRLLHSGEADDLMDEIPTVVVPPLPRDAFGAATDSYVVLNRPYAFVQWLKTASIPERYLVMCEADHLFLRPMPNMMNGEAQGGALFTYINPDQYAPIVRSLVGDISDQEIATIPRIGNSPTFVSVKDFRTLAPAWVNMTLRIWDDEAAHKAWNWVLEMYGYTLSTYATNLHKGFRTHENMLAHPPWDTKEVDRNGQPFYLLHLTYPLHYNATGGITDNVTEAVWSFDKRVFSDKPPPRNLPDPPPVVDSDLARIIIRMFNQATAEIPCWDEYWETKRVTTTCAPSSSSPTSSAPRT